ncbi:hypothetical protein LGN20_27115 [Burkholderia cepacia]|uniref:hypothetical protein n=1 Tax=Burkholderia cepacia TaxID=292 RepID=UPI000AC4D317|nr:hypothetical protein [Burkholderia cepacia]MCA8217584.1 hypothetical protein [Burkholderia cepacia]
MDDEVCTTHTHVARLRVMQTTSGRYRGIVHLHRIGEDPGTSEQHDTEGDFASDVEARDAARTLAHRLLEEQIQGYEKARGIDRICVGGLVVTQR